MKEILELIHKIFRYVKVENPSFCLDVEEMRDELKKLVDKLPDDNSGGEAIPHSGATAKIIKTERIRGRLSNK